MRWRVLLILVVLCWPGWAQPLAYLWRFSRAPEGTVLDSQRFYTVAEEQLWAGRLVDGKVLWKKPLHNLASGPVLDQGRLHFISDGSLPAVDAASGASLWKQKAQTFALSGGQLWCSQPKISRLDQAPTLEAGGEQLRVVPLQPGQRVRLHISPNTSYCSGSVQLRYVEADTTELSAQPDSQFEVRRSYFRGKQRLTPPISLQAQEQITVELDIHCKQNCEYVMLQARQPLAQRQ